MNFQRRIAVKVHSDEPHGTAAPRISRLLFSVSNSRVARDYTFVDFYLGDRRRRVKVCNTRHRKGAARRVGDTIMDKLKICTKKVNRNKLISKIQRFRFYG